MTRTDLPASVGGNWTGLTFDVERPARPGLRIEVAGGRRLLLRQADRVVLLGRQRTGYRGVYYARTGLYRSPLPPIRTAHARNIRETSSDGDAWAARWTHQFADWLQAAAEGPVNAGRWTLARGMPSWAVPGHWGRLQAVDPEWGHVTWFGYGDPDEDARDVLPLRRLSPADAGRVKSYRRQFREGILPPALLWWVSGLNTLLVLDGHDRISAALAEHAVPDVIVLAPAADPRWADAMQRLPVREYEGRVEHHQALLDRGDPLATVRVANEARRLAVDLGDIARSEGRTRAWPLPGGQVAWDRYAADLVPDWTAEPLRPG